jgi:hypothetical protein
LVNCLKIVLFLPRSPVENAWYFLKKILNWELSVN